MLTVACVWVAGQVPYTVDYVTRLESMARRVIARPFSFVCLTDRPSRVLEADVEQRVSVIQIPKPSGGLFGWWSKVQLFNPYNELDDRRILYLDLDTLLVAPLDPIIDYPAPFALAPHAGTFQPKNGLQVVRRFNSSVMVWDAGHCDRLFTAWSPAVAGRLWGDQDWIGEQMPDAAAMPLAWFPRLSEVHPPWPADAKVVLCKKPKNTEAAVRWPWFREAWV
jgi:hypothetical protein